MDAATTTTRADRTSRHFEMSAELYSRSVAPLFVASHDHLARLTADRPTRELLDVGCGDGRVAATAARGGGFPVTAVDRSGALLALASGRTRRVRWVRADATALPFAAGTFDLVLCNLSVATFAAPVAAARELRRVTADDGLVVVSGFHGAVRPVTARAAGSRAVARGLVATLGSGGLRAVRAEKVDATVAITDAAVLAAILVGETGPWSTGGDRPRWSDDPRAAAEALLARHGGTLVVEFDFVFVHSVVAERR